MNYNFTDRVRKVLAMAREEAIRLQHDYVGTEHILLGLIREGEGVAAAVLQNLSVDLDQIHERVEESVRKGKATIALGELPYTSRAKKVLSPGGKSPVAKDKDQSPPSCTVPRNSSASTSRIESPSASR